jgi:hypothetical protein
MCDDVHFYNNLGILIKCQFSRVLLILYSFDLLHPSPLIHYLFRATNKIATSSKASEYHKKQDFLPNCRLFLTAFSRDSSSKPIFKSESILAKYSKNKKYKRVEGKN